MELLNELRVALPGVQVLFAFLLTVPFTQRFSTLAGRQRAVYFGAMLATALASVLLMAPTAHHRLRWRAYDKEQLLSNANRLAISGLITLAAAIAAVVFLIGDVVYGSRAAGIGCVLTVGVLGWFWFGLPLSRRAREPK